MYGKTPIGAFGIPLPKFTPSGTISGIEYHIHLEYLEFFRFEDDYNYFLATKNKSNPNLDWARTNLLAALEIYEKELRSAYNDFAIVRKKADDEFEDKSIYDVPTFLR